MSNAVERLKIIGADILAHAENDSREITRKAHEIRESELLQWEDIFKQTMSDTVYKETNALRMDTRNQLARMENQLNRDLLLHRKALLENVFDAVRANLIAHTKTPQYREDILQEVSRQKDAYDHAATTVSLREADLGLAEEIRGILGADVQVTVDRNILIGGFTLYNEAAAVLLDETMDLRLSELRPWFLEHCNLKVH